MQGFWTLMVGRLSYKEMDNARNLEALLADQRLFCKIQLLATLAPLRGIRMELLQVTCDEHSIYSSFFLHLSGL